MFVQTNSIQSLRKYFKEKLSSHYTESEIRQILNATVGARLNLSSADLIAAKEILFSESDLLHFRSIVKRLLANEPFQYVVGNTFFYDLEIKCDARALVPRPETEELVEWVKESFEGKNPKKGLDLCTGTGCIAIALKSIFPQAAISASDLSDGALALAKENMLFNSLNIEFVQFDATKAEDYEHTIGKSKDTFDFWVSNPPYIPLSEKEKMATNVIDHEPMMALFVPDEDALLFYREIAQQALIYLRPKGLLFFEIHENFSAETVDLLRRLGFIKVEVREDLQGKTRMVKAEKV